ncbi:hypothetical protein ACIQMR_35270 [Streptomyces sp. NPDC091376]|uniref:hypothetical protein n=1 Tax=Streptomyces sp. NPDC091376 TaxID=3365994 RepID=UPI003805ABC3
MKRSLSTIHTADGSIVTVRRRGLEYDLETVNARGETIATVVMNQDDLHALYSEMDEYTENDAYDEGYQDGYRDAQGEAA